MVNCGNIFRILIALIIYSSQIALSQEYDDKFCDSLYNSPKPTICIFADSNPELITPIEDLYSEFLSKIDISKFVNNIYLKVYIDTFGLVNCPTVIKGNDQYSDSIAVDLVSDLKFFPAKTRGTKIPMEITIPFLTKLKLNRQQ